MAGIKARWFKLNPAEFLADRNVERMSIEAFGLYSYLLMRSWLDGGIPADLDEIGRYSMLRGIDREHLARLWREVAPCWVPGTTPGTLVNPRQEREREAVAGIVEARTRAGRISAQRRTARASEPVGTPATTGNCDRQVSVTPTMLAAFERLAERYPNATKRDFAFQVWMTFCETGEISEAAIPEIEAGLQRWLESELWARDGGRYIPSLAQWLHQKRWLDRPIPSAEARRAAKPRASRDGCDPEAEWLPSWRDENGELLPEFRSEAK